MFREEIERLLRHRAEALDGLARAVADPRWWPARTRHPSRQVGDYLQLLLSALVSADGTITVEELGYLRAVYHDDMPWDEEWARAKSLAARVPELAWRVPDFFVAGCRCDAETGSHYADSMLGELDGICELMLRADDEVTSAEATFFHSLMHTLRAAQLRHGELKKSSPDNEFAD